MRAANHLQTFVHRITTKKSDHLSMIGFFMQCGFPKALEIRTLILLILPQSRPLLPFQQLR